MAFTKEISFMTRKLLAPLAGTLVIFIWSTISWMVLPWHNWDIKSFNEDGAQVERALKLEATHSGIYLIPNLKMDSQEGSEEAKSWQEKANQGPFAFISIRPDGAQTSMPVSILVQLLSQFIGALACTWILMKRSPGGSVYAKGAFVALALTVGTMLPTVQNWNWWGFPTTWMVVTITDTAIGWFLAGLAIAKALPKPQGAQ